MGVKALRSYSVGDVFDFVVGLDSDIPKKLCLAYSGAHCQVWVDNAAKSSHGHFASRTKYTLTAAGINVIATIFGDDAREWASPSNKYAGNPTIEEFALQLGKEFDRLIFPQLTRLYGQFCDRNEGFVYILLYDFPDNSRNVLGFVGSDNLQGNTTLINVSTRQNPYEIMSTTAHEFTHSIAAQYDRVCSVTGSSLPRWVNEGLAEVSAHLLYGANLSHLNHYISQISKHPSTAVLVAPMSADVDEVSYYYGKSYVLMLYIVAEVARLNGTTGTEVLRAIMTSPELRVSGNHIWTVIRSVARGSRWMSLDELLRELDNVVRYAVNL